MEIIISQSKSRLSRLADNEVKPMEEIVLQHQTQLLRLAIAIMGSKTDAEDVVQDVFVKLIEKNPTFDSDGHRTAWLITVTKNVCKTRLRSHWRKDVSLSSGLPLLDTYPAQNNEQRELMEIVGSLPAKYRMVIHLFYYEGYSTKEIAQITEQKESTVRMQLTRAREMLKKFLTE
jgi:RNA polymerase sigma-70 factor (ECF subfamily)